MDAKGINKCDICGGVSISPLSKINYPVRAINRHGKSWYKDFMELNVCDDCLKHIRVVLEQNIAKAYTYDNKIQCVEKKI